MEGESGQQSVTPDPQDNRDPWDPRESRIVPGGLLLSNTHTLSAYWQVQDGPNPSKAFVSSARDSKFCVSSARDAMFLLRASPGRLLMVLEGFGVKISLKVSKTIKIHTFLLGIVVFAGKKPPEADHLRKPHTWMIHG